MPTPNVYRTASGAPGSRYWQQRADYDIAVDLDDENQRIIGSEKVVYFNRSPDVLRCLWVQLDANLFSRESDSWSTAAADGADLPHSIAKTMMRVDLPEPLGPGGIGGDCY